MKPKKKKRRGCVVTSEQRDRLRARLIKTVPACEACTRKRKTIRELEHRVELLEKRLAARFTRNAQRSTRRRWGCPRA